MSRSPVILEEQRRAPFPKVELSTVVLKERRLVARVEVGESIAAGYARGQGYSGRSRCTLAVESVITWHVGKVSRVDASPLEGTANRECTGADQFHNLALELKRGGILCEGAAGENIDITRDVATNTREDRHVDRAQRSVHSQ